MRVGITACSKSKQGGPESSETWPARELYDSWLFDERTKALEATCDRWAIFSAKFGYVEPDDRLPWYDCRLSNLPEDEQQERAQAVANNVQDADTVMILMGRDYADPLIRALPDAVDVEDPLKGVGLFDQRAQLKELYGHRPAGQAALGDY